MSFKVGDICVLQQTRYNFYVKIIEIPTLAYEDRYIKLQNLESGDEFWGNVDCLRKLTKLEKAMQ